MRDEYANAPESEIRALIQAAQELIQSRDGRFTADPGLHMVPALLQEILAERNDAGVLPIAQADTETLKQAPPVAIEEDDSPGITEDAPAGETPVVAPAASDSENYLQERGTAALDAWLHSPQDDQDHEAVIAAFRELEGIDPAYRLTEAGGSAQTISGWLTEFEIIRARSAGEARALAAEVPFPDSAILEASRLVNSIPASVASESEPSPPSTREPAPSVPQDSDDADASEVANLPTVIGSPRVRANFAALELSLALEDAGREPTPRERAVLDRWRSWGAVPEIFDTGRPEFEPTRRRLAQLVGTDGFTAARRTTINAHYTDPAMARPMWRFLEGLGVAAEHTVLEPGCGAGGFFDHAPEGVNLVGVELDPTTARIAAQRHPRAQIHAESFAEVPLPDNYADAVIGNVPFADVALYDPRHNPGRTLNMHNHFIVKSLAMTTPGGVVAVLTSRYTMDSRNSGAREAMYAYGDLIGAVRLPTGAHARWAGTDVVTDLVAFRRRGPLEARGDDSWLSTAPVDSLDGQVVNTYFTANPARVLGNMEVGQGIHGRTTILVRPNPDQDLETALESQLNEIAAATRDNLGLEPDQPVLRTDPNRVLNKPPRAVARAGDPSTTIGFMSVADDGRILRRGISGDLEPADVPKSAQAEVRELLGMRDVVLEMLQSQAADVADTPQMEQQRRALRTRYDAYVSRFGPINRYSTSYREARTPGKPPIETRRVPSAIRAIANDPFAGTVKALELFDDTTQTARPAVVFTQRVVAPRTPPQSADSPADALAITLDARGSVDLEYVADLLSVDPDIARGQLGTLVFEDPGQDGALVTAAEYLSGDVRAKLRLAQEAARTDPTMTVNIDHLQEVIPADLSPADITARIGAVWIPADDLQDFLRETLDDPRVRVAHDGGSNWVISGNRSSVAATQEWGTTRRDAITLAESLAMQRRIAVEDTILTADDRERTVLNPVETAAAQEKADALQERFGEWVWEDPTRADRLLAIYNERFNSLVMRQYDTTHMTFPGLAASFTPRPHQKAAVARMIYEPSVGLFHEVGAGKTAEMVMGCMELRRLGLVNKPAIVVPNHMLEQFHREFLQLYPQAQILAASTDDLAGEKRREFVSRAALGDWDAVILTQGAFRRIPVSPESEARYVQDSAQNALDRIASAARRGDDRTVKQAEKDVLRATEKAKDKLDVEHDPGITWEMTGIDYLCVDEMHMYKNLAVESRERSLAVAGSQRAADLDLKIGILRAKAGERGRVLTGATATPIANSVSEMFTMQHYLRPDLLKNAGITDFDSWAVTFGQSVTDMELDPAGTGYRIATRFAKFQNVPDLLRIWSVAADVKTAEDLGLPTPELTMRPDGIRGAQVVVVEPPTAVTEYVASLAERAERVRSKAVTSDEDNMLVITSDGRAAALDLRLVNARFPAENKPQPWEDTKISTAADNIAAEWRQHRDDVFLDAGGVEHPNRGALHMVFCDLGTPNDKDSFTVYDELRDELVARGMDPARIRYIHEANNDAAKARIFEACRSGQVDVIMGSTSRMGVGTNIQTRAASLHHLDCPWRPADIAQREGRIVRQGNQNPEVSIYRYVTARTFDAYSWQTVERKASFIGQVLKGRLDVREIEEIGGQSLSFAEVKALAADNPFALRRAQAQAEVQRLERTQTAHSRGQSSLERTVRQLEPVIQGRRNDLTTVERLQPRQRDTRGDAFSMRIEDHAFTKRADAAGAIERLIRDAPATVPPYGSRPQERALAVGGMEFDLVVARKGIGEPPQVQWRASEAPFITVSIEMRASLSGSGIVTRLENAAAGLDQLHRRLLSEIEHSERELTRARANLGKEFPHSAELKQAREELRQVEAEIAASISGPETAPPDDLAPVLEAVMSRLPGAELDGEALLYDGRLWAPAGSAEREPTGYAKEGFWGHADEDGQVATANLRWDADPNLVAQWIRQTSLEGEPVATPAVSGYGYNYEGPGPTRGAEQVRDSQGITAR